MEQNTCYMCNEKSTSREHIPPISIFPEQKDIKGINFRKNLITVPSCDLHNLKKSKDDEFLMACLAGIVGNNIIGFIQTKTKVARAFQRRGKLQNAVIKNPQDLKIKTENGIIFPLQYGTSDNQRLLKCFKHIAYGLYFYKFKKVFTGECEIIPGFLDYQDENSTTLQKLLRKKEETDAVNWAKKGDNQDVFYYQFSPQDEFGLITLILTFYQRTKVYIAFQDSSVKMSYNLTHEFIKAGFPVIFEFPDGSKYEFNKK